MGIGPFIPLIASAIQAGGNVAAAKLGGRGGGRSFLESLGPILEAEAQRRAKLSEPEQPVTTPPFNPDAPIGVPGLDEGKLGGLDILGLLRRQAFGGGPTGGAGFSAGSFF